MPWSPLPDIMVSQTSGCGWVPSSMEAALTLLPWLSALSNPFFYLSLLSEIHIYCKTTALGFLTPLPYEATLYLWSTTFSVSFLPCPTPWVTLNLSPIPFLLICLWSSSHPVQLGSMVLSLKINVHSTSWIDIWKGFLSQIQLNICQEMFQIIFCVYTHQSLLVMRWKIV